jgi:flagellar biosynthesis protein FlhB
METIHNFLITSNTGYSIGSAILWIMSFICAFLFVLIMLVIWVSLFHYFFKLIDYIKNLFI